MLDLAVKKGVKSHIQILPSKLDTIAKQLSLQPPVHSERCRKSSAQRQRAQRPVQARPQVSSASIIIYLIRS